VEDLAGEPDALARAAGIGDTAAVLRAREKAEAVHAAERALRRAVRERDAAIRAAAMANPGSRAAALARAIGAGLTPGTVSSILRRPTPPAATVDPAEPGDGSSPT
jgi:hypothetical protein